MAIVNSASTTIKVNLQHKHAPGPLHHVPNTLTMGKNQVQVAQHVLHEVASKCDECGRGLIAPNLVVRDDTQDRLDELVHDVVE